MVDKDTLKIVNDALDAVKLMNREWQGLSDDEILDIKDKLHKKWMLEVFNPNINSNIEFAWAIEQALKEKNT